MLTRRAFMIRSLGATVALVALREGGSAAANAAQATGAPGAAHAAGARQLSNPSWQARHGLTGAEYQAEFDELVGQGYRLVDVSGYEVDGQARYAAIWEQSAGPAWQARHGLTGAEYQATFDQMLGAGYRLTRVSGYGVGGTDYYAAIWEESGGPAWQARHGLSGADYQAEFDQLVGEGYRLVDISGYEVGGQARYAAIWEQSAGPAWQARHGLSAADYQAEFDRLGGQGYRLARVSGYGVGGTDYYAAVWEQSAGPAWQARHGLTGSDYQDAFDEWLHQGYRLLQVSGYAAGGQARFAGIWESRGFAGGELDAMATVVDAFMTKYGVPGASVAVAKDGRLVYARASGLADQSSGREVTIRSLFRIASVAKPITSVAILELAEQGKLKLSDTVFGSTGILGTTYGTTPYGTNIEQITIQHLLEHTSGGWMNDGNDPMFSNPTLSQAQLISWVLDNRPLDNAPGTAYAYSNFGYCVLGRIVEKVSGQTYDAYVKQNVLATSGIGNMHIAGNTLADRRSDEVVYYGQNGEDPYGMQVSRMDAHGGWLASAIDLVRFAVRADGFPTQPDLLTSSSITTMSTASAANAGYAKGWAVNAANNWWHNGSLPGTTSILVRTSSGFCWAALVNTRQSGNAMLGDIDQMMWDLHGKVSAWPSYDLF